VKQLTLDCLWAGLLQEGVDLEVKIQAKAEQYMADAISEVFKSEGRKTDDNPRK